ncbi:hypothetical protein K2P97_10740 [bacterium]|nr:hypothetical protein [bacterium]
MKSLILALVSSTVLTHTAQSEVLIWRDLELGSKYILNTEIPLDGADSLVKDGAFLLEDVFSGYAPVMHFAFKDLLCTNNQMTSELMLFNPEPDNQSEDKSIGVQRLENCYLEVMIEPKYYYDNSVFESP